MNYKDAYGFWLKSNFFDEETKKELLSIEKDEKEIEDRFYKELEFGTGGLRGVIGAGTNRMNFYTVRKATQGLANYIKKQKTEDMGVAIAYDSRKFSPEFALEAALCLCANGIKAYLFDALRPTPELSFAVRHLGCTAGIVVTASHNPPEYNGYKVYWADGGQITAPRDKEIINEVKAVESYYAAKTMEKEEAIEKGLLISIGEEIDDAYMAELKKQIIHPDVIKEMAEEIKIVYTPLHGTGNIPVRRILSELGFQKVYVVKEQELPDSNFSTVSYPNPEDPKAFTLALELAKKVSADIILATDPDADRLGIYALDKESGEYIPFTGNMSGMLIAEYILSEKTKTNTMPDNPALVKTVVTTNMADVLAADYNVELKEVLTGFKYIGEQIKWFEETGSNNYVFGLEESYGCLAGTHARDKDAVVAVMCLCEVAAFCKKQGITLWDQMINLYEKYGYFKEGLHTITLKGVSGQEEIRRMMELMRNGRMAAIGDFKITAVKDFATSKCMHYPSGRVENISIPKSNVLYYELENNAWCCVRPSGTEPKIKFYMGVKGTSLKDSEKKLKALKKALLDLVSMFSK
ncbi:MAG: phospho-sugar mutase [Lachnospiraceae bacterium]|nr:phospho-sugar mutase [Lachnospiraceae bacterium]